MTCDFVRCCALLCALAAHMAVRYIGAAAAAAALLLRLLLSSLYLLVVLVWSVLEPAAISFSLKNRSPWAAGPAQNIYLSYFAVCLFFILRFLKKAHGPHTVISKQYTYHTTSVCCSAAWSNCSNDHKRRQQYKITQHAATNKTTRRQRAGSRHRPDWLPALHSRRWEKNHLGL